MLQQAHQQGQLSSRTQFLLSGHEEDIEEQEEDHDTAWQFIQDHRSVKCHHRNIPISWILLDSQCTVDVFINHCFLQTFDIPCTTCIHTLLQK